MYPGVDVGVVNDWLETSNNRVSVDMSPLDTCEYSSPRAKTRSAAERDRAQREFTPMTHRRYGAQHRSKCKSQRDGSGLLERLVHF